MRSRDDRHSMLHQLNREMIKLRIVSYLCIIGFIIKFNTLLHSSLHGEAIRSIDVLMAVTLFLIVPYNLIIQPWSLTDTIPMSCVKECLPWFLKMVPYSITRKLVVDRLNIILQTLTNEEAEQVSAKEWRVLYKYFSRGSSQQHEIVVRVASLLHDKDAIPYLQRIVRSRNIPLELRDAAEKAIWDISN
ncbi:MAG: hypothetical protein ABFD54_09650 [Armatimonadota bacterium]|nr:hypothetical protein [bacterium]